MAKTKKIRITIRVDIRTANAVAHEANRESMSSASYIRRALLSYMTMDTKDRTIFDRQVAGQAAAYASLYYLAQEQAKSTKTTTTFSALLLEFYERFEVDTENNRIGK